MKIISYVLVFVNLNININDLTIWILIILFIWYLSVLNQKYTFCILVKLNKAEKHICQGIYTDICFILLPYILMQQIEELLQ